MDAALGDFWRDLIQRLPAASDDDVQIVDAETIPIPEHASQRAELWALAGAEGGDAVAARWETERRERIESAAERPFVPISATRLAARSAPPSALAAGGGGGRDFGSLVHRLLEWVPSRGRRVPRRAAAGHGRGPRPVVRTRPGGRDSRRGAGGGARSACPCSTARDGATRVWREMSLWFPDGEHLVEGKVDLVFEEDGQLVVVDYKSDAITDEQALAQAAHHAPQLQLYGRGLSQALGQPVRERLVLFTALGRTVPV